MYDIRRFSGKGTRGIYVAHMHGDKLLDYRRARKRAQQEVMGALAPERGAPVSTTKGFALMN